MDIRSVFLEFRTSGNLISVKANHQGHINSTFIGTFQDGNTMHSYTLQKINRNVFKRPEEVMENITLVTNHIRGKLADFPDRAKRCLSVIESREGLPYFLDEDGQYWRMYDYIGDVMTYETIDDASKAYLLGEAVGRFQNQLSDFDGKKLHATIPNFHNMATRYEQLGDAVLRDPLSRFASVKSEYSYLMDNRERGCAIWNGMESGLYPLRVTHNDTKMNNVLFSRDGKEALCIIDLDTVMPGTILFDTGDMIRTATNTAAEDERDTSLVSCDTALFSALIRGYRSEASTFLTEAESSAIAESGRVMTQIMAVRFLTDYIAGDVYYKIDRPSHNLDRARTQIALMRSMDREWPVLSHA